MRRNVAIDCTVLKHESKVRTWAHVIVVAARVAVVRLLECNLELYLIDAVAVNFGRFEVAVLADVRGAGRRT